MERSIADPASALPLRDPPAGRRRGAGQGAPVNRHEGHRDRRATPESHHLISDEETIRAMFAKAEMATDHHQPALLRPGHDRPVDRRQFKPDRLLDGPARVVSDPDANVGGFHLYTFGEVVRTERWRQRTLSRLTRR